MLLKACAQKDLHGHSSMILLICTFSWPGLTTQSLKKSAPHHSLIAQESRKRTRSNLLSSFWGGLTQKKKRNYNRPDVREFAHAYARFCKSLDILSNDHSITHLLLH